MFDPTKPIEADTLYMRVVGATGPGHPSRDVLYALLTDIRKRMVEDYAITKQQYEMLQEVNERIARLQPYMRIATILADNAETTTR